MRFRSKYEMIQAMEEKVNANLDVAIASLQNMTGEELNSQFGVGTWSIAQNLEHLNFYSNYYLPEIEKALQKATTQTQDFPYKSSWLGAYFVKSMDFRRSGKMKAFKAYVPSTDLNAKRVVSDYITNNEGMLRLLRDAKDVSLMSANVPVSIAKFLKVNLGDIIQVVVYHEERHMEKVKEVLTVIG